MRAGVDAKVLGGGGEPKKASAVAEVVAAVFRLRPGEVGRVALMFSYMLAIVSAFIVGRTVRDTLFLSRYPVERLPLMYVAVAVFVSLVSYGYSRYADRFRRDRVIRAWLAIAAVALVSAWVLLKTDLVGGWIYPALYILVEIVGGLAIIQFWTFANDIFSSREGKRLFGLIGAGGVLSNVVCGFAIGGLAKRVGPDNLILVSVGLLGVSWLCVGLIAKDAVADLERAVRPARRGGAAGIAAETGRVFESKHLTLIAGIVAVTVLTSTFLDYQFKVVCREAYGGRERALASFFGYFYAITGVISCVIQFFVTSRLIDRAGIAGALLILPASLALGSIGILSVPVIPAVTALSAARGAENVFRYTINDATMQLLYTPVAANLRGRAKAFIDGMLKPMCIGLSGVTIYVLTKRIGLEGLALKLAWVDLLLASVWMGLVFTIRGEYVRSLLGTLRTKRLDVSGRFGLVGDEATARALKASLGSKEEHEVLHALELLGGVEIDVRAELEALLAHPSESVRVAVLRRLSATGRYEHLRAIGRLLDDPDAEVRAAAVRAYSAIGGVSAFRVGERFLADPSAMVRGAAVASMIEHGGLDGMMRAADGLKSLLSSERARERVEGARALGELSSWNFYQPILDLLRDPDPSVRVAAVEAAGALRARTLLPTLIYQLRRPELAPAAVRALSGYGAGIEPVLLEVLANPREDSAIRRNVARVLGRIGGTLAFECLIRQMTTGASDLELRAELARAALRLRETIPGAAFDDAPLSEAFRSEIEGAYSALCAIHEIGLGPEDLLYDALENRHAKHLRIAFWLLEMRYPGSGLHVAHANLNADNKRVRANAVEVIDNIVTKEDGRLLVHLIEDHPLAEKVARGLGLFPRARRERSEWLRVLLADSNRWVVACAMDYAGRHRLGLHRAEIRDQVGAEDPLLRETALRALALFEANGEEDDGVRRLAEAAGHDPSPLVREAGEQLRRTLSQPRSPVEHGP